MKKCFKDLEQGDIFIYRFKFEEVPYNYFIATFNHWDKATGGINITDIEALTHLGPSDASSCSSEGVYFPEDTSSFKFVKFYPKATQFNYKKYAEGFKRNNPEHFI